ncbi:hypothetical protein SAMN02927903_03356 [Flavobacterium caeni]|uniref:DUF2971 domain-containing protein n=2 Tax=Flavobacterium caeni TaxID=490189 RepID=A0A1G5KMJ3_9FLAO|nr:hypothetical protein SAMN02927903_03356 [Flavobacterium caeni]
MSFENLVEILEMRRNTLLNPEKWDDKHENMFLNSTIEISGMKLKSQLGKSIFCQCWSFTKESDTMWRAYSTQKNSVKISSTPRKLLSGLLKIDKNVNKVFVGKVTYLTSPKLKKLFLENAKDWIFEQGGLGQCKTLLYKRYPFKNENEVRLIYNTFTNFERLILKYEIDPDDLIDNIVFDPRIEYSDFKSKKIKLQELGFKKSIVKSNLYKSPDYNTIK